MSWAGERSFRRYSLDVKGMSVEACDIGTEEEVSKKGGMWERLGANAAV